MSDCQHDLFLTSSFGFARLDFPLYFMVFDTSLLFSVSIYFEWE